MRLARRFGIARVLLLFLADPPRYGGFFILEHPRFRMHREDL